MLTAIGIDLGGTKIAGIACYADGTFGCERRISTPKDDYDATVRATRDLAASIADSHGWPAHHRLPPIGVGIPGSIAPQSGRVQNANSTWLNGRRLGQDLSTAAGRPVVLANDANCLALSEAADGAAAGASIVLAVILGTGCGAGIVVNGSLLDGPRGTSGEWGHNPLPWPGVDEYRSAAACWCGQTGCLETWISGPALAADHSRLTGDAASAEAVAQAAVNGNALAMATLTRHAGRVARGLATLVNVIDPHCIVVGGGLSNVASLYEDVPRLITPYLFSEDRQIDMRPARWGDASGVRGAARLAMPGGPAQRGVSAF